MRTGLKINLNETARVINLMLCILFYLTISKMDLKYNFTVRKLLLLSFTHWLKMFCFQVIHLHMGNEVQYSGEAILLVRSRVDNLLS